MKTATYAVITYMKINPAEHRDYIGKQGKLFLKSQTQNFFFFCNFARSIQELIYPKKIWLYLRKIQTRGEKKEKEKKKKGGRVNMS